MRQFTIRIQQAAFDALERRAIEERRPVRDQAAWLLEDTLLGTKRRRDGTPTGAGTLTLPELRDALDELAAEVA